MRLFIFIPYFVVMGLLGCAYNFGYDQRDLPGGYKQVAIPVFKNTTQQVGIEGFFTSELIRQFNRSQVAKVISQENALVVIEGKISNIKYIADSQKDSEDKQKSLPAGSVLTTQYRVILDAEVDIRRMTDQKIIWKGKFSNEKVYTAPQLGLAVINSANALYNQSARMEVFELMAKDMMAEAHDRMTENF